MRLDMMDSPPPTQVPLSRDSYGLDPSRLPPASPPVSMLNNNSGLGSPPHGGHLDRDNDMLVSSMGNGLMASHSQLSIAAQAHAAAMAAAQYHNQTMLAAAHAHSRHPGMAQLNPLIRKNMMSKPGAPYPSPPPVGGDHACKMIKYRDREVAAFMVENRELICLPQAFELFLKDLVGGLHTVYTKLKRLDIQPVVCNVEQVRILRGLGAIAPGVNRCKLISCSEFDVLYEDCTNSNARPGRPPKRSPSIHHATPETLDKLSKKREEMGYFEPRYYGEPKAVINGFPHNPWATPLGPYLHMGMNPAMMGQPSMSAMIAASQFAMRADNPSASAKDRMDPDVINRPSQDRLPTGLNLFSPPSLPPDHPLAARHPDDAKPMNLSNGHARDSLSLPPPNSGKGLSDDDDDDDEMMNEDKNHSDDDNDADMDDNSNDAASDSYSGRGELDKSTTSEGRPDLSAVNGGMGPGGVGSGQGHSELEKVLQSMVDFAQKAMSMARCSQRQISVEREDLLNLLRENELTIQGLKRNLNEARLKNEELRTRLKREKRSRSLQESGTGAEGSMSSTMQGSMQSSMQGSMQGSISPGNNAGSAVPSSDMGLDLAIKPASSPDEPTRTQTTDAAESENEGDKIKAVPEREIKISEPCDRVNSIRDSFDVFSAAAALASSGAVAGGSPPVRFPGSYLPLIGGEVQ